MLREEAACAGGFGNLTTWRPQVAKYSGKRMECDHRSRVLSRSAADNFNPQRSNARVQCQACPCRRPGSEWSEVLCMYCITAVSTPARESNKNFS